MQPLAFQRGQPFQRHIQNRLGLDFAELEIGHQIGAGRIHPLAAADGVDHLVQNVQGAQQPFHNVGTGERLGQVVFRAAAHNLPAMLDE